jgi:EmrB/QacA subfamily drug resistance transporter
MNAERATITTDSIAYKRRWLGLVFIGISLLVVSLDNTILNVAIPSIATELGASASDLQWIIDAYILVFAALLLTMGAVGDRYGRKRTLQIGLILFGVGSFAAGFVTTTGGLTAMRAFMGLAGAMIMPATLSIISATFPDKERPQAIAIWAAVFGLGIGLGPVLGGWLLEHFAWNSIFLVNVPIILVALIGGYFLIGESKDPHAPRLDLPGVVLSIVGLFALVYGIVEAGTLGWTDPTPLTAFAVAAVFLGLFAWWENRNPHAMLPLELFRNMSFTGANFALVLISFGLLGGVYFLSQYLQSVLGYTPLEAGLRMIPMSIALIFAAALSARLAKRLGTKYTVALGAALAGVAMLIMSTTYEVNSTYDTVVLGMIILGLGLGTAMSPATNSVMGSVPVEKAGVGSAMNDTTRQLGGALGIAVLGSIMIGTYLTSVAPTLDNVRATLENIPVALISEEMRVQAIDAIERGIQGAGIVAERIGSSPFAGDLAQTIRDGSRIAFVDGMTSAMLIGACIMFGAALLTLWLLPSKVRQPTPIEAAAGDQRPEVVAEGVGD